MPGRRSRRACPRSISLPPFVPASLFMCCVVVLCFRLTVFVCLCDGPVQHAVSADEMHHRLDGRGGDVPLVVALGEFLEHAASVHAGTSRLDRARGGGGGGEHRLVETRHDDEKASRAEQTAGRRSAERQSGEGANRGRSATEQTQRAEHSTGHSMSRARRGAHGRPLQGSAPRPPPSQQAEERTANSRRRTNAKQTASRSGRHEEASTSRGHKPSADGRR